MAIKYLAGDRLIGTAAERTALETTTPAAIAQTSWKELGRTKLTSSGSTCTVTGLANKDNLMILRHTIGGDTAIGSYLRVGNGSIDSGSNYAERASYSGASGTTAVSQAELKFQHSFGVYTTGFDVTYVRNIATEEKLFTHHYVYQRAAGAGNAPERGEAVGKWTNTSNVIDQVQMLNASGDTGAFQTDTELIVLGCDDDEADSGTNFWQELASTTTTSVGDTVDSGVFTAKKYLMINAVGYRDSASILPAIRLGNSTIDGGNNYTQRQSVNGGSDATLINESTIYTTSGAGYLSSDVYYIINASSTEKLVINHGLVVSSGNSAPDRQEIVGKWTNTSAQANRIHYSNQGGGSSNFDIGSKMRVWGGN